MFASSNAPTFYTVITKYSYSFICGFSQSKMASLWLLLLKAIPNVWTHRNR